ncbi:hypothetical protein IJF81_03815 [bacterium]|nr:hypothetical protein [bacterium]
MNEKVLNIILIVLVLLLCMQNCCKKCISRYEVVPAGNMLTILIDHQTGMTWRNSICSEKSPVPGCWARMYTIDNGEFNLPIGEQSARKKELKLMRKLQKLQSKNRVEAPQPKEPVTPQPENPAVKQ